MESKKEFHISITEDDKTAVDYLAEASGFSKQKIKRFMQKGCVWLERLSDDKTSETKTYIQRLRRAKKVLKKDQIIHFYYDERVLSSDSLTATLIEDFGDYSIWNKPSGMLSQGSKWGDFGTIYRYAEMQLKPERPTFIVHRLDRAANGLIILAHKKTTAKQFSRLFESREIEKRYLVKVEGNFTNMISSDDDQLMINEDIDDKSAISHVKMMKFNEKENTSLLEVQIDTGRKHQIRKHLSGVGFPVVGDRLHGLYKQTDQENNIDLQLQAYCLAFTCPITGVQRSFKLDS